MAPEGARLGVGVSGGGDSVALLHLLRQLGYELTVLHLNHKLRGEESDADEAFVIDLARRLGVPCETEFANVCAAAGNLEAAAREARRAFFRTAKSRLNLYRVALGHTRSDQAETVLFRVLRGTGRRGLSGILPATRDGLIRPLIEVSRAEVRTWLTENGLPSREDSTNLDSRFARNRIRHALLPQLAREWNPAIESSLSHLAAISYEEERYWAAAAKANFEKLFRRESGGWVAESAALERMPKALARRVLLHALQAIRNPGHELNYEHIEAALDPSRRSMTLPGAVLERSFEWVRVAPAPPPESTYEFAIRPSSGVTFPGGTLRIEGVYNQDIRSLTLRNWRPGDAYQPKSSSSPVKLKELFQRARVPSWQRPSWPVLTKDNRLIWAKKFGPAAGIPFQVLFWDTGEEYREKSLGK